MRKKKTAIEIADTSKFMFHRVLVRVLRHLSKFWIKKCRKKQLHQLVIKSQVMLVNTFII